MKKLLLPLLLLSLSIFSTQNLKAQNNVGIGTTNPNSEAILDLDPSSPLGLLMPRLTLADTSSFTITAANDGMIFYATDINAFVYYDASTTYWTQVGSGAGGSAGADGLTTLITAIIEAPGVNCTDGGQRIDIGLDDNDDATLQGIEIDNTFYVCNGADGIDGNTIVSGTIAPTTEGVDGDYYFDTDDFVWYGPKAAGVWPTPGDTILGIDGLDGLDGADGNTVLNGIVDPTLGDGVDGDFFINTATDSIFGPKSGGVWGTGISLVGADGADGDRYATISSTAVTIGLGSQTLFVEPGLAYSANQSVVVAETGGDGMEGSVTSYNTGTGELVINVTSVIGAGNLYSLWDVNLGGAPGPAGTDGLNSLANSTVEAPGVNCTDGGQRIDIGLDDNDDGILQAGEIDNTYYVCDGADGAVGANGIDGLNSLAVATIEAPGVNCTDGGQRIDVGLDANADLTLQAGEISATYYICDGATGAAGLDGLNSLATSAVEAPGVNCADGGQRIDVGLDDNDDGILQAGEIDNTYYVCDGAAGPASLQAAYDGGQTIAMTGADIDITSSGTNPVLTIDDTNENVGIGTATPNANYQLDVVGGDAQINGLTVGRGGGDNVNNVAMGLGALASNISGASNVAIGRDALSTSTNSFNVAVGRQTLQNINNGLSNTAIGQASLGQANGTGGNVGIGFNSGGGLTTGDNNTFLGSQATAGNNTLTNSTAIGYQSRVFQNNSMVLGGIAGTRVNVSIATYLPNTKADLTLGSSDRGLQLNRVDRASLALVANDRGMTVYDSTTNELLVWDGATWISTTAGGASSLQSAYDGGQTINMGTGNIDFISSGANSVLYIDEGNERIGIGTNSPSQLLDVVGGNINIDASSAYLQGGGHLISQVTASQNVFVGGNTNAATGANNTVVGFDAGNTIGAGADNTVMGFRAGQTLGNGNSNTMIGKDAGNQSFNTSNNTFIGDLAGEANFNGQNNTMVGRNTGATNTSGNAITLLGTNADAANGLTNATAIGAGAVVGASNSLVLGNGATSVGIGTQTPANKLEVIGDAAKFDSVIIVNGAQVGYVLTAADATGAASWQPLGASTFWDLTGNAGTVDGTNFLGTTDVVPLNFRMNNQPSGRIDDATSGYTGIGYQSGNGGAGANNTAFGFRALALNTADGNTAFGSLALENNTGTAANTGVGYATLRNISGVQNTAVGNAAMENSTTGDDNVAVGYLALLNTDSDGNTAIGSRSMVNSTTGLNNVAIGYNSLANTTVDNNTAVGSGALTISTTGSGNTAIGQNSMVNNLDGQENTAVGLTALFNNSSGSQNTGIGFDALFTNTTGGQNVGIGWRAGFNLDGGSNNVFIGYDADAGSVNIQNSTAIGYNALVDQDNSLILGDTANISVGIGTTAPQADLHIQDDLVSLRLQSMRTNSLASYEAQFGRTDGIGNFVETGSIGTPGSSDNFQIQTPNNLQFRTNLNTRLSISSAGTFTFDDFAGSGDQLLAVNNLGVLGTLNLTDSINWARNGNDIYNTNTGSVVIGTSTINNGKLQITTEINENSIQSWKYANVTTGNQMRLIKARGTEALPTALLDNDDIARYIGTGNFGGGFSNAGSVNMVASEDWSAGSRASRMEFETVNLGTTASSIKMTLDSEGSLGIGTTNPNEKLSVNEGNIFLGRSDGNDLFVEMNGDNNGVSWSMGVDDSQDADFVISNSNDLNNPILYLGGGGGGFNGDMGLGIKNPGVEFYQPTNLSVNPKTFTISSNGNVFADNRAAVLELHGSSADNGDEIGAINFTNQHTNNIDYNFARISAHRENTNPTISSLRFYTRNFATMTEAMVINNLGNVGIGTATPNYKLSVNGPLNLNEGIASGIALRVNGAEALWYSGTYFSWGFGGSANFFSDNIGIGTSTPNGNLQFANTTVNRKIVLFESTNNDHQFYGFGVNPSAMRYQVSGNFADHVFYAAASATTDFELMRIEGTGDVGIGNSNPGVTPGAGRYLTVATGTGVTNSYATIEIQGGQGTTNQPIGMLDFVSNSGVGNSAIARIQSNTANGAQFNGELEFYTRTGNPFASSNLTFAMRLTHDDNIESGGDLITNSLNGVINVGGSVNTLINVIGDAASPTISNVNGDEDLFIEDDLEVAGAAYKTGGGSWLVRSDARLKKNIEPFNDGLSKLMQINPVSFQYNGILGVDQEKTHIGIIAQDVEPVLPYTVEDLPLGQIIQEDENGNDVIIEEGIGDFKIFDPSSLDFIMINAIKEQQQIIETQSQLIQNLESRIQQLENK